MAYRKELPFLEILVNLFEHFNQGRKVKQDVPAEWELKAGDQLEYNVGPSGGIAEVVSVEPQKGNYLPCIFRKVT